MLTVLATAFLHHGAHSTLRHHHGQPVRVRRLHDEMATLKALIRVIDTA
jgi:hypothetical protein